MPIVAILKHKLFSLGIKGDKIHTKHLDTQENYKKKKRKNTNSRPLYLWSTGPSLLLIRTCTRS